MLTNDERDAIIGTLLCLLGSNSREHREWIKEFSSTMNIVCRRSGVKDIPIKELVRKWDEDVRQKKLSEISGSNPEWTVRDLIG